MEAYNFEFALKTYITKWACMICIYQRINYGASRDNFSDWMQLQKIFQTTESKLWTYVNWSESSLV